ncbi:7-cyano-7-deazaguanine synthase [Corallococcus carmarthensis]|uniref:7-cyano-7-deazaguanine synthase n=1 Tax=Corallococcus carmarthensis TaxID=2316728 RepID=UPI00148D2544|nr:7-cyano-7-deazaguanine synthase [Corallococcus carmarthensis]NOK16004.1 7-cyano-7-deazaguanine synthase [Corallococcus carmarthensis]
MKTALLLSGGMDSIAIAWWRRPELAITVDYGQRSALAELRAAASASEAMGIEHLTVKADLSALGSGDMAGSEPLSLAPVTEWWPYRNQMLVTLAAMKAVAHGVQRLLIGTLKTDGLHADGRPDFIMTQDALLRLQEGGLRLEAPAIALTSTELIRASSIPMEVLAWAHSCHVGIYACGQCRGCQKHYQTLAELGVDPY